MYPRMRHGARRSINGLAAPPGRVSAAGEAMTSPARLAALSLEAAGAHVAFVLACLLGGCTSSADLSRAEALQTDYVPGATYRLLQDRLLEEQGTGLGPGRLAVVRMSIAYAPKHDVTVAAYRAAPRRWPHVLGVLEAGTRIRLVSVERRRYPMLDDWYEVTATIASGAFAGRKVDISRISAGVPDSRLLRIDPLELARVIDDPSP